MTGQDRSARTDKDGFTAHEVRIERVVSGGQTGVDRAALDAAMGAGIPVGGWCPRHRRAEDGPIPERYPLKETASAEYEQRTSWNVRDSDGTLILTGGNPTGGTALTIEEARRRGKPFLVTSPTTDNVRGAANWIARERVRTLNVAGPRASTEPGVNEAAMRFMTHLLAEFRSIS